MNGSMEDARPGLGWLPELPDIRDYHPDHDEIAPLLAKTAVRRAGARAAGRRGAGRAVPACVDLRAWCSPIEDQKSLGSCTAHAAVGLVEYFERRASGKHVDASRLFVYKATRQLMHAKGDSGAYLRTAMQALVMFGAPPEEYWPYRVSEFDAEPPAFVYSLGASFKAVKYFHLDPPGSGPAQRLAHVKRFLAARCPSMFGFTVYESLYDAKDGKIPFPGKGDKVAGGHAVVAVGYDDGLAIGAQKGALLIRNSWGTGWGDKGYGWLPYEYVTAGLADDFWSVQSLDWVNTGQFA